MKRIGTITYELSEKEHRSLNEYLDVIDTFVKGYSYRTQDEALDALEQIKEILNEE